MNQFKIISDGKPFGTKLVNAAGDPVGFVQKITWSVSVDDQLPKCTIELVGVGMDVLIDEKDLIIKHGAKEEVIKTAFESDDAAFEESLKFIETQQAPVK